MIKLALKARSTFQNCSKAPQISSKIKRKDIFLFKAFTLARICVVSETKMNLEYYSNRNRIKPQHIENKENLKNYEFKKNISSIS